MAYSRHQSFYIKNNWINKGIKAINSDPYIFNDVSNYLNLGIGKNMFFSMKYWLEALNIVTFENNRADLTIFGKYILKTDLSCDKALTLNLLHFYLVLDIPFNGIEMSHSFYWFFNKNQEKIIRKMEVVDELVKWDTITYHRNTSENTISRDIDCLLQTYTKSEKLHPEDKNVSVLSKLSILLKQKDHYLKLPIKNTLLDRDFFMFSILYLNERNDNSLKGYIDLNSLENSEMSPGKIFNLTRLDIIEIIEEMISNNYPIQIVRTNNLDTLKIDTEITANQYLRDLFVKRESLKC